MAQALRRAVRVVRPSARADLQPLVRWLVKRRRTRRVLNALYGAMTKRQKEEFYWFFAQIFRDSPEVIEEGLWRLNFAGKRIVLPLTNQNASLTWGAAVSILGHDAEVKNTYEVLIKEGRVKVFFDVGANYGLHTLLFLAHGIRTISFEPNPVCHDYLRRISELNGLDCEIQPVALGAQERESVELWFPENDTWFGTTDPATRDRLSEELTGIDVRQTTLDAFVKREALCPELIKIDTEGNELSVLRGGLETLRSVRPLIIFESWNGLSPREDLYALFAGAGYAIAALPLKEKSRLSMLGRSGFMESQAANFIALPDGYELRV